MNSYKLCMISIVVLSCRAISGMNDVPLVEGREQISHPELVREVSEKLITVHLSDFESQETKKNILRNLALISSSLAAGVGAGYMANRFHKWFTKAPEPQAAPDIQARIAEIDGLRQRIVVLEAAAPQRQAGQQQPADEGWLGSTFAKIKNTAKEWAPQFVHDFIKAQTYREIARTVLTAVPVSLSLANFISESRSLNTAMILKSNFYYAITTLINWTNNVMVQPDLQTGLEDLSVCGTEFIGEMEKILAYIKFVSHQLKPEQITEKRRSNLAIKEIKGQLSELRKEMNEVIMHDSPSKRIELVQTIRLRLFNIVVSMENFEIVVRSVGFHDPQGQELFTDLKAAVMPRVPVQQLRPADDTKEDEEMTNMLSEAAFFVDPLNLG